jgi:hypothetical protein
MIVVGNPLLFPDSLLVRSEAVVAVAAPLKAC